MVTCMPYVGEVRRLTSTYSYSKCTVASSIGCVYNCWLLAITSIDMLLSLPVVCLLLVTGLALEPLCPSLVPAGEGPSEELDLSAFNVDTDANYFLQGSYNHYYYFQLSWLLCVRGLCCIMCAYDMTADKEGVAPV